MHSVTVIRQRIDPQCLTEASIRATEAYNKNTEDFIRLTEVVIRDTEAYNRETEDLIRAFLLLRTPYFTGLSVKMTQMSKKH